MTKKALAVAIAMSMLIVCVPVDAFEDISLSDLWSGNEKSVPPTYIENENGSDTADPTPSIEAGTTETEPEMPEIEVNPNTNGEIPVTPSDNLSVEETTPADEVVDVVEETTNDADEDGQGGTTYPTEPLEHLGGTDEVVEDIVSENPTNTNPIVTVPVDFVPQYDLSIVFVGDTIYEWRVAKNNDGYHATYKRAFGEWIVDISQFPLPLWANHWTDETVDDNTQSNPVLSITFDNNEAKNVYLYAAYA